jgi:hypothetical protein
MATTTIVGIDSVKRCIVIMSGITDSFGNFHPNDEEPTAMRHPSWSTMTEEEFEEAAVLDAQRVQKLLIDTN